MFQRESSGAYFESGMTCYVALYDYFYVVAVIDGNKVCPSGRNGLLSKYWPWPMFRRESSGACFETGMTCYGALYDCLYVVAVIPGNKVWSKRPKRDLNVILAMVDASARELRSPI
jgi:hypothetical protein